MKTICQNAWGSTKIFPEQTLLQWLLGLVYIYTNSAIGLSDRRATCFCKIRIFGSPPRRCRTESVRILCLSSKILSCRLNAFIQCIHSLPAKNIYLLLAHTQAQFIQSCRNLHMQGINGMLNHLRPCVYY